MVALLAIFIVVSCKKDKNESFDAIVGHWHVSNFEPSSSSDTALMAKDVIAQLIEAECFPLEYSFSTDGKVSHIDKMSYLEPIEGENGVEVYCFFENIFKDGTFTINNDVLTLNYDDETEVLNTITGSNSLIINNADFILMDETMRGKLTFTKEAY